MNMGKEFPKACRSHTLGPFWVTTLGSTTLGLQHLGNSMGSRQLSHNTESQYCPLESQYLGYNTWSQRLGCNIESQLLSYNTGAPGASRGLQKPLKRRASSLCVVAVKAGS